MRIAVVLCAVVLLVGSFPDAWAQGSRTGRMIVPAAAGGSADLMGRLVAEQLQKRSGQTWITENRSGAGQTIGTGLVAKSEPDGNTLALVTITYTTSSAIYSRLPFDPLADLRGVAMVGDGPLVLTVHPSFPARSVKDLVAFARARPGDINYASAGAGTIPHLATELFALSAKINIVHVPYNGIAPAVTATVAGEVPMLIGSAPSVTPMVKARRLRALAVTTAKRSRFMPELPTIAEAGVPGYDVSTWWGVLAPGKTPDAVVGKLNREIRAILAQREVRAVIEKYGAEPVLDMTAEQFDALIKTQIGQWRRIVKERGIKRN